MRPLLDSIVLSVFLCLVICSVAFSSCTKEQHNDIIPTKDYEATFSYEVVGDDNLNTFTLQCSVNGIEWNNVAEILPLNNITEYTYSWRQETGTTLLWRVRANYKNNSPPDYSHIIKYNHN